MHTCTCTCINTAHSVKLNVYNKLSCQLARRARNNTKSKAKQRKRKPTLKRKRKCSHSSSSHIAGTKRSQRRQVKYGVATLLHLLQTKEQKQQKKGKRRLLFSCHCCCCCCCCRRSSANVNKLAVFFMLK